jgi:hypothetical protein
MKFLPALFVVQCDQQLFTALGLARCRALLPCLLVSIDALVQAVDSCYESYHRNFGQWQHGKKETPEKAADLRHVDNHGLVRANLLPFSDPFWTSSADIESSSI